MMHVWIDVLSKPDAFRYQRLLGTEMPVYASVFNGTDRLPIDEISFTHLYKI